MNMTIKYFKPIATKKCTIEIGTNSNPSMHSMNASNHSTKLLRPIFTT